MERLLADAGHQSLPAGWRRSSIVASGHTVFDLGVANRFGSGVELNLSVDNLTNRDYYETQNYFESRVARWRRSSRESTRRPDTRSRPSPV